MTETFLALRESQGRFLFGTAIFIDGSADRSFD
jgi:hypothetical protein